MKRIVSILLAVCMCVSVCVALSSCGHSHTYKTEWSSDATHHWHDCEGEGCTEVSDKAEHSWNAGEVTTQPTPTAAGVKTYTCTVCEKTKTEPIEYVHSHTYKTEWSSDATHHWHACQGPDCTEVSDKAEHTWNAGEVTTQPTPTAAGVKTYTCTVCAGTKTEPVEYVPATTVTEAEWNAAFNFGNNWAVVSEATNSVVQQTMTMTQKRDGNKFSETQVMTNSATGDTINSYEEFSEIDGDVWYDYNYDTANEKYVKVESPYTVEENLEMRIAMPAELCNYENYTYDENTDSYFAASITIYSQTFTNVTLRFEDGKLVSMSYTMERQDLSIPYTMTFTYGNVAITLPEAEIPVDNTLTEQEWADAFDFGINFTITSEVTLPGNQQTMTVTVKRDENKFANIQVMTNSATGDTINSSEGFSEIDGDVWYDYNYDTANEKYVKVESPYTVEENLEMRIAMPAELCNYENYTYDEDTDSYVAESITADGQTFTNVTFRFEDGKLVSMSYSTDMGGTIVPCATTFTYGGVSVTLPTVE